MIFKNNRTAFIALGSNLNNPRQQIDTAIKHLKDNSSISDMVCSSYYLSEPLGPSDQPQFINACCRFKTNLSPSLLLDLLQSIEQKLHRVKTRHWGERIIDLDLLYIEKKHGTAHYQQARLTIPHPMFSERDFVLLPLKEVVNKVWPIDINLLIQQLKSTYVSKIL